MALQNGISRTATCLSCQKWILRSAIAAVGGPTIFPPTRPWRTQRHFSRAPQQRNQHERRAEIESEHPLNAINHEVSQNTPPDPLPPPERAPTDSYVPWYLQVQQPLPPPEHPLADRQRIPDLPDHAPSLLSPLLQHVSQELGMDDLSLLDLRSLEPPPALGANLLMIIGTARSEKHLHVSADRLCRWLRTQYKLSPHADGLLGRNELKLKLRRKAKRSRLLSAVGAKETSSAEVDDGIRTGWICVNVGRVPDGELPRNDEELRTKQGIVGFGPVTSGSNIVVQLMTEEKRGDIDLEKLWTDVLHRSNKEKEKRDEPDVEGAARDEDATPSQAVVEHSATTAQPSSQYYSAMTPAQQLRAFHSSTRRMSTMAGAKIDKSVEILNVRPPTTTTSITEMSDSSLISLEKHLSAFKNLSRRRALDALGDAFPKSEEPEAAAEPFVNSFYGVMPPFPGPQHWHKHIELLAYARQLGHDSMHAPTLVAQLEDMQTAGLVPEERTFKLVLHSILAPLGRRSAYDGVRRIPSEGKTLLVLSVLESMESYGYDPVSPDLLELLYHAFIGPPSSSRHTQYDLHSILPALGLVQLRRHISVEPYDWQAFWRAWRSYPQHFLPRSAEMYTVLFEAIAEGKMEIEGQQKAFLKSCLEEMEMEEPAVRVDAGQVGLTDALVRAIEFVQPAVKDGSVGSEVARREWAGLYERCRDVARLAGR